MKATLVYSGSSSSLESINSSNDMCSLSHAHPTDPTTTSNNGDSTKRPKSKSKKCTKYFRRTFRRKNLVSLFPILKWGPEYNVDKLVSDVIAGLTTGLTVIPGCLAYATVAGLPPIFRLSLVYSRPYPEFGFGGHQARNYGLYSSFVGCFVYVIFGSTKAITIGPTAIQSILTFKYTADKPPEYAVFLCFITAVVTLAIVGLRLSFVANFISSPVISGFTSGVALTIVATQVKFLLGIQFQKEGFLPTIIGVWQNIQDTKKWDAILSLVCILSLLFCKYIQKIFHFVGKKSPKLDKALWLISVAKSSIVIVVGTIVSGFTYPDNGFSIVGHITPGLPSFQLPPFEIFDPHYNRTLSITELFKEQASALIVLPCLGIMGHITIAKVFAGTERVDATQEILVIGISNAISCFFSSMPIGGSFSRTTVNAQSGVQTPAGGLLTGAMVLLALEFLTGYYINGVSNISCYFYYIPKSSLAAVICVSCIFMVDFSIIVPLWRSKKMDLIPWGLTFLSTIFIGLEYGILVGLLISTLFLLYYTARPRVKVLKGVTTKGTDFVLIQLDRSLTFPSVDYITYEMSKAAARWGDPEHAIVVDCHHIQFADFTAAEGVRDYIINMNNLNYRIIFWKVKPSILRVINAVMINSGVPFLYSQNDEEVEALIDNKERNRNSEVLMACFEVVTTISNGDTNSPK